MNLPVACPQSGQTLEPLTIAHPYGTQQYSISGINATAVNQIVASPASNLAFLTYTGSTPGAKLPYYMPGSAGAPGTLNYVTLAGGSAVTAPVTGAFSLDDKLFFVSTAGDNLIHFVNTTTLQDTQQINPNLPACTPGSDPGLPHHDSDHKLRAGNCDRRQAALDHLAARPSRPQGRLRAGLFLRTTFTSHQPGRDENPPLQHDRIKG